MKKNWIGSGVYDWWRSMWRSQTKAVDASRRQTKHVVVVEFEPEQMADADRYCVSR